MKIVFKNSTLVFQKREPKNSYTWEEITSAEGYLANWCLVKDSGNIESNNGYAVSPAILLEGATAIAFNGLSNSYLAKVGFYNSAVSDTTAVYYVNGDGSAQGANGPQTIDSTTINAAIAAGADSFRVSFMIADANGSIDITRPES